MDGITGILCDKRIPPHVKGNSHKMIVQPAMLNGMETVPMTSSHAKKPEVTEMKMCRRACGQTLRDHVRNDDIRERLKVGNTTESCRKARWRWFGTREEVIPRIRRKKVSGHGNT